MNTIRKSFFVMALAVLAFAARAQSNKSLQPMRETDKAFYTTAEARRIGDQVMLYQRVTGGWPKNIDMAKPLSDDERKVVEGDKVRRDDSTIDNNATTTQVVYLARLYQGTGDKRYREAFLKGMEFLLSGQYENGGWPQFWPEPTGYRVHITYNDGAIVNVMNVLNDIAEGREPYVGKLVDKKLRKRAKAAYDKGIECILNTQIIVDGKRTIWCQQHDHVTLQPASARAYELPSYCPMETTGIMMLLMQVQNPDDRVKSAIHGAMAWLDKYKMTGVKMVRTGKKGAPDCDTRLVDDPEATPIWARFYDLEHCRPYVCDRDGVPRRSLQDIGSERRNGYLWYASNPLRLYKRYDEWAAKYDPAGKVNIDINGKGFNETMLMTDAAPQKNASYFDAVVNNGESIQQAIEKAPEKPEKPFCILIRKGVYNQKVVIDRPNIVLVGEDRDSTIIQMALLNSKPVITEYNGKQLKHGVVELLEGADDCVISGLTIYNNYGTTVEPTTSHQMAVYGRATRTIIINSNIWADGNDALSLWAKDDGLYYHADLFLRCAGVDFLCPRGWCFATRCKFLGDGHAIIWHDGRGDKSKKLVICNSSFDAKCPTHLGRYHHDSQFYLLNCKLSERILDRNISYAYTDKVLDPCPWGPRIYYYGCEREGGDSGWLKNNLKEAEGSPEFYQITAKWVFGNRWDPEKHIRDLWNVLEY